ncbi:MAG: type III pantothenate kinase [Chitinophagaceae bacterium]|nr:type III pantothenate kinase [Chitinophagaceae bacterium]MCW5905032.1 type III pantothenate kinase [Chitinophagaceae bacterium]
MQTTICFDFGNTRLKYAVFNDAELKDVVVMNIADETAINAIIQQHKPDKTILSSVIHHNTAIEALLQKHTKFHQLNQHSKLPFTIPVGKPETVGADRLAICAAAVHLYPNSHNLAIGLGTCITYNFINKFHEFLGGSISPGMNMRFQAMNQYTALLPLIEAEHNFPLIGYDTKTNLLSGVLLGMAKEIDGIIEAYNEKYTNFNVLITGGDVAFFVSHIKNKIFADPYLIFKGLYAISEYNN